MYIRGILSTETVCSARLSFFARYIDLIGAEATSLSAINQLCQLKEVVGVIYQDLTINLLFFITL